eukprot:6181697-Pleurochrysis_carterae.AAC.2
MDDRGVSAEKSHGRRRLAGSQRQVQQRHKKMGARTSVRGTRVSVRSKRSKDCSSRESRLSEHAGSSRLQEGQQPMRASERAR